MLTVDNIDSRLIATFERTFHIKFNGRQISVKEIEEWDSLTHIKLIIAIESEFGIEIEPDFISLLYSDFETIFVFLKKKLQG